MFGSEETAGLSDRGLQPHSTVSTGHPTVHHGAGDEAGDEALVTRGHLG